MEKAGLWIKIFVGLLLLGAAAGIGIPIYWSALREENERQAQAGLKQIGVAQTAFKFSDADRNGVNDYWTADIAGLQYLIPSGATQALSMIGPDAARADGNTEMSTSDVTYSPPYPPHVSAPLNGYWLQMQSGYEPSKGVSVKYGARNPDRFSSVAAPDLYRSTGRLVYIVNESGRLLSWDPGLQSNYYARTPEQGVQDPSGVLTPTYAYFPASPD